MQQALIRTIGTVYELSSVQACFFPSHGCPYPGGQLKYRVKFYIILTYNLLFLMKRRPTAISISIIEVFVEKYSYFTLICGAQTNPW